jgi:hypothetical protein
MTQPHEVEYHISPNNGSGWYWEVVNQEREVIARGLAHTHDQARVDAMNAGGQAQRPPVERISQ